MPDQVVLANDGTIWYNTESTFGHITKSGTLIEFAKPEFATFGAVDTLVAGPDGNLWFTVRAGSIGKITLPTI